MRAQEELERAILPRALEIGGARSGQLVTLPGQASTRRYHRVTLSQGNPPSLVIMELGTDAPKSEEASGPVEVPELPFLNVQQYLERGGIPVPRLYHYDVEEGLLFLEDLGDETLESVVAGADAETQRRYYELAIEELLRMQRHGEAADPSCIAFSRSFDYDLLHWELDHFREWLLEADRGASLSAPEREVVASAFARIARTLAEAPRVLVHRDYQSRNILVQDRSHLRIIDFQDALIGPCCYDLVALLRDSYVELEETLCEGLISRYADRHKSIEKQYVIYLFQIQTLQRKLKDAGRFVYIDRVKKNASFLRSIPLSLRYVRQALGKLPEFESLHEVLAKYLPELS